MQYREQPLPQTANRQLLILDPSLKDMGGHFYEYNLAVAAAASTRQWRTSIYVHKSCEAGLHIPYATVTPWFSVEWAAAGGNTRKVVRYALGKLPVALRIPLAKAGQQVWRLAKKRGGKTVTLKDANISSAAKLFGDEVAAALRHADCGEKDIVFLPTIRTRELFGLWRMVQRKPELQRLQFHIALRRDAAEMDLPEDGAPGISFLFREMQAAPAGKAFHFYCDTQPLCDDYALLTSPPMQLRLLPIPFPNPAPDRASLEQWSGGASIKLVYLGGARTEKGFHLIPGAAALLQTKIPGKLLWRLQAPVSGALEDSQVIEARRALTLIPAASLELVERNLTSAEFKSLLLSADIVLLPYLPEFYRARSSGILVQALAAGKPVVVPSHTWLSSQVDGLGATEFAQTGELSNAILQAVQQLPKLRQEALKRAAVYAAFHNADALLQTLEGH
jgi:hypothetical protein